MLFSNVIFGSFACALLAPVFGQFVAAEVATPVFEEETYVAFSDDKKPHEALTTWTFELDKDVVETPELVAQIQEAFILAANEVHDNADFIFNGVAIKKIRHEKIDLNAYEGDDGAGEDSAVMLRGGVNGVAYTSWRMRYRAITSVTCNLCGNGDRFTSMRDPDTIGSLFYEQQDGAKILNNWEKNFCGKLKGIKLLRKPSRCFIDMEINEDEYLAKPTVDTVLALLEN